MGGRDEAPMFMLLNTGDRDVGLTFTLAITADLAMVARTFTLPIAAGLATVGRNMWPPATTGRLELVAALRSVEVRAAGPAAVWNLTPAGRLAPRAAQVMVSRRMLLAEAIGRLESVAPRPIAVGRLVRVTTMSLILLCETIVRRVAAAARAVARVAAGTTCRLT